MSPDSPEPNPDGPTDASREGSEAEAVETFTFDVSAGNQTDKDERTSSKPTAPTPRPAPAGKQSAKKRSASGRISTPAAAAPIEPERAPAADSPLAPLATTETEAADPPKKLRRGLPSWTVSLALHAVVLVLLSFYTLVTLKEEELGLYASTAAYEEVEEFQEVEIDPSEDLESLESDLVSELSDPGEAAFGDLSAESALADAIGDTLTSDSLGDLGNMFGELGDGLADQGDGPGGSATASFFGTTVQGNRVVYVVDNSGGMRRGELESLIEELLKSVDSLTPKQMFYVIFYSDALYPLFYPQPVQRFVKANDKNKQRLREWLDSVEFCLGNVVDEAMGAATAIRPDVVYLLTDGDLDGTKDQRRIRFLLSSAGRSFSIHTFGMGTGEEGEAARKLKAVAEANRGTFRAVVVSSAAKDRAREKNRPYHNKEPGRVWGRRVGAR